VVEFRGNVQTRLKKLRDGVAECTFLACAGLARLGMTDVPATPVDPTDMLPAVAQGAIGIERRADDDNTHALLAALHDVETGTRVTAERAFLAQLDGSCETPIAGLATITNGTLRLEGEVLRPDGSEAISDVIEGPEADAAALGSALGERLLKEAGPGFFDWH
jgi:hydroxymethylbilane synthase